MSNHYESSHYGGTHFLSTHYGRAIPSGHVHPRSSRRRKIIEEDETIMAIIIAFLEMKDH